MAVQVNFQLFSYLLIPAVSRLLQVKFQLWLLARLSNFYRPSLFIPDGGLLLPALVPATLIIYITAIPPPASHSAECPTQPGPTINSTAMALNSGCYIAMPWPFLPQLYALIASFLLRAFCLNWST